MLEGLYIETEGLRLRQRPTYIEITVEAKVHKVLRNGNFHREAVHYSNHDADGGLLGDNKCLCEDPLTIGRGQYEQIN